MFIRNVLVFECADVGLEDVNRQTYGQTGTQVRQTEHSPIHVHEHKRKDVACRITNISYANYYKSDEIPRARLICIPYRSNIFLRNPIQGVYS
jgi:hypothetical protein